jgi:hypothetical protein
MAVEQDGERTNVIKEWQDFGAGLYKIVSR